MSKVRKWLPLIVSISVTGCVASGTGILAGTQNAQPGDGQAAAQLGQPVNGASANKVPIRLTVSTDSMVLGAGKMEQAQGSVTYNDGTKDTNIMWSSSDSTIVTVNNDGKIQGLRSGVATIQAKAASDPAKFANITVTVKAGVIEDVLATISPKGEKLIAIGGTLQLSASVQNTEGTLSPNGSWSTSNAAVAKVSPRGLVTGVRAGKATITFRSDSDLTVQATTEITVTAE